MAIQKTHEQFINEVYNINKNIEIISKYNGAGNKVKCRCLIDNQEWEVRASSLISNKTGCPFCQGQQPIIGVNDLKTTSPEIYNMLKHKQLGSLLMKRSHKEVILICPICKNEIFCNLQKVSQERFVCKYCSDGISYPNKLMYNILSELKIDFESEFIFSNSNYRYDFYIKSINTIIEMNGAQHYGKSFYNNDFKEIYYNDIKKYNFAIKNNIENYIIIDSSNSDVNYIRENIIKSKLYSLFDFSNLNWDICDKNSRISLVKKACDYYNNGYSIEEICNFMSKHKKTVIKYLKFGSKHNICDYELGVTTNSKKVICLNTGEIFKNIREAEDKYKAYNISRCCQGKNTSSGKLEDGTSLQWRYLNSENKELITLNRCEKPVIQYSLDGLKIMEYKSISQASKITGVGASNISICCRNTLKHKTAGGYIWRFK